MNRKSNQSLKEIEDECRALVNRYALMSAASSAVPLPGVDVAVDLFNMMNCLNAINKKFGLAEEDVAGMSAQEKILFQSIVSGSATMLGKRITAELIMKMLARVGIKSVSKQFVRYIPLIGSAVSATIGFKTFSVLCNQHIDDCLKAVEKLGRFSDPSATVNLVQRNDGPPDIL